MSWRLAQQSGPSSSYGCTEVTTDDGDHLGQQLRFAAEPRIDLIPERAQAPGEFARCGVAWILEGLGAQIHRGRLGACCCDCARHPCDPKSRSSMVRHRQLRQDSLSCGVA